MRTMLMLAAALAVVPTVTDLHAQSTSGASDAAAAQRTLAALRLGADDVVELDGRLDEPFWQRADVADGFVQQEPNEGAPATEPTEVRIVYDDGNLYIGAILHDSDPSGILGRTLQRDAGLGSDDRFMWILDTFLDGRTGYFFEINPAGLMGDGLLRGGSGGSSINKSWDGVWEARVARGPDGWSAEIRIPFSTLNFDPDDDVWGINFQRTIRRRNEELLWSGHRRNQGLFRAAHAGRLTGIGGVS
ncbi:MAG: carbohydrate binding family 9 domain-containing protein, partial [Gemmatimonadota bacterium]